MAIYAVFSEDTKVEIHEPPEALQAIETMKNQGKTCKFVDQFGFELNFNSVWVILGGIITQDEAYDGAFAIGDQPINFYKYKGKYYL
jgi:hypothetical protein